MKRIAAVLLAAVFVLSAAACSREGRLEISASEIMFVDSYQKNVYDETQISYYEEPTQQILARVLFSALPGKGEAELYYVWTYYAPTASNLNAGQRVQKGTAKVDAGYLETGLKLKLEAAEEETLEAGSYQLSIRTHEGGDLIIQSKITVRDPDAPEEGETIPAEDFTQEYDPDLITMPPDYPAEDFFVRLGDRQYQCGLTLDTLLQDGFTIADQNFEVLGSGGSELLTVEKAGVGQFWVRIINPGYERLAIEQCIVEKIDVERAALSPGVSAAFFDGITFGMGPSEIEARLGPCGMVFEAEQFGSLYYTYIGQSSAYFEFTFQEDALAEVVMVLYQPDETGN